MSATIDPQLSAPIYINGQQTDPAGGQWLDSIDSATAEPFARVARGTRDDIDAAVNAAAAAQPGWDAIGPAERGKVLMRLADLISSHEREFAEIESRDVGKPLYEAIDDVQTAVAYFRFYGESVDKFYNDKIPLPGGFGLTDRIPHGVTGHITPWNYPVMLLARTIAPALAMGNAAVLKPSELTSLSSVRAAMLATEAGLPDGVLNVVPGLGEEAGAALADHPRVDHMSFTGSREVGKLIMHASADHMRPVMLELGGKSPSVVFDDVSIEAIVPKLRTALLWNNGQTCNAQSRVLVARKAQSDLVDALAEDFRGLDIAPGLDDKDLASLVSSEQYERVTGYIELGRTEGARLVTGGSRPDHLRDGYFVQPTIFETAGDSRVAQEEIFGPVLTVTTFDGEEEAIRLANGTAYDLAAAVWTQDIDRAFRVAGQLRAGQVYVNNWSLGSGVNLPFGGIRNSGFGREKGLAALAEYSALKTTVVRVLGGVGGR
ncbi:MAG: aldehyde dehydrogenase family protein [Actinomycetota bacterium]